MSATIIPSRRRALGAAASAATATLAAAALPGCASPPAAGTPRAPFVLVHGAWHGAWCWRELRRLLTAQGHEVFTPTLTGMGERHHLSSAAINLDTHTADLVAVLKTEELQGAVLVAHSYAGLPALAALPQLSSQLSRLVLLDALLPEPGRSAADAWPPQALAQVRASAADGFRLAPFPPAAFGVPPGHPQHDWLLRRLTDMPLGPLLQPFPGRGPLLLHGVRSTYLRCTLNALPDTRLAAQRAAALGLPVRDLVAAHDAMVTAPDALTQQLLALAGT
ncbi:MAG: alpha/beta hydrolase [Rubrivivax sp.]|nr:alpha/beta hydrolase [Rubrivivax sp.]